jgi:hypothetical protein
VTVSSPVGGLRLWAFIDCGVQNNAEAQTNGNFDVWVIGHLRAVPRL